MKNRNPLRGRIIFALLSVHCLAGGSAADAVTVNATVQANVSKPLQLSSVQNLDLGTVGLLPGSWSGATVALSRTGVLTCTSSYLTCSGATSTARYNVRGQSKTVVNISAPNVTLINSIDASQTLKMIVDNPGTVTLANSGAPGTNFDLGGSITLNSAIGSGNYQGTFSVTVDYQ